jgi:hypothetical protein
MNAVILALVRVHQLLSLIETLIYRISFSGPFTEMLLATLRIWCTSSFPNVRRARIRCVVIE